MKAYKIETISYNSLEDTMNEWASAGWELHTAAIDPMGRWKLIFEKELINPDVSPAETGRTQAKVPNVARPPRSRKLVNPEPIAEEPDVNQ